MEKITININKTKEEWIQSFTKKLTPINPDELQPFCSQYEHTTVRSGLSCYYHGAYDRETDQFDFYCVDISSKSGASIYSMKGKVEEQHGKCILNVEFQRETNAEKKEIKALLPVIFVVFLVPTVIVTIQEGVREEIGWCLFVIIFVMFINMVLSTRAKRRMIKVLKLI
ncbi:MAG: hypothetical protein Q4D45_12875 [Lachnospiraceae bacterium]|nr:hypothetical protein [Lachnospiraceae bacterium]